MPSHEGVPLLAGGVAAMDSVLDRRSFLLGSGVTALARPAPGQSSRPSTLRIVPQADLASLDPIWTTAVVTTSHGYAIFDTLYALD